MIETKQILDVVGLYENAPFILDSLKKLLADNGQEVNSAILFQHIQSGIRSDTIGLWIQFNKEKPTGVICILLKEMDNGHLVAEIAFSDYLAGTKTKTVMDEFVVPWAQMKGAKAVRTFLPATEEYDRPATERYLRRFKLEKKQIIYERVI